MDEETPRSERPKRSRRSRPRVPELPPAPAVLEPEPRRRLRRSLEERMLGGVCGGLGRYLGVDPTLVRIAFVLGSFAGGAGIVAYLAALLLVPAESLESLHEPPSPPPPRRRADRNESLFLGLLLLGLGSFLILSQPPFGYWGLVRLFNWGIIWPLALILFGVWFLGRRSRALDADFASTSLSLDRPRLLRSRSERLLAGVCGGLSEHFRIDVSIVRIIWVLLTVWSAGIGLIIYVALALIVPDEG